MKPESRGSTGVIERGSDGVLGPCQHSTTPSFHHSTTPLRIITLGVYGFTEHDFFAALHSANVDTFCDIRRRRGVRGREYAFVNHRRLEARLATMGIRYLHFKDLAPTAALRERQKAADQADRTAKRQRTELSELFVSGYREECLQRFDSRAFVEALGAQSRVAAFFCVERSPAACHRSLVAERLRHDLGLEVIHLTPPCAS